ncbi:MAG: hypothetical protein HC893_09970 [Chloroflexaceae bacterium]|nr:hypothetical protein [Chloroflexaceae bacterium]
MDQIAEWITQVLNNLDDETVIQRVANEVRDLCSKFPVPGHEGYVEEPVGVE